MAGTCYFVPKNKKSEETKETDPIDDDDTYEDCFAVEYGTNRLVLELYQVVHNRSICEDRTPLKRDLKEEPPHLPTIKRARRESPTSDDDKRIKGKTNKEQMKCTFEGETNVISSTKIITYVIYWIQVLSL